MGIMSIDSNKEPGSCVWNIRQLNEDIRIAETTLINKKNRLRDFLRTCTHKETEATPNLGGHEVHYCKACRQVAKVVPV